MNNNENSQEFLNIGEVAKYLRVSRNTVRGWSNSGALPAYRVGSRQDRRYVRGDVIAFAKGDSLEIGDKVTASNGKSGVINAITSGALFPFQVIDENRMSVGIFAEGELRKVNV